MSSLTSQYTLTNDEWMEIGTGPNLLITYGLNSEGTVSLCLGAASEEIDIADAGHVMTPNDKGVASFSGLPGGTTRVFAKSSQDGTNIIVSEF